MFHSRSKSAAISFRPPTKTDHDQFISYSVVATKWVGLDSHLGISSLSIGDVQSQTATQRQLVDVFTSKNPDAMFGLENPHVFTPNFQRCELELICAGPRMWCEINSKDREQLHCFDLHRQLRLRGNPLDAVKERDKRPASAHKRNIDSTGSKSSLSSPKTGR